MKRVSILLIVVSLIVGMVGCDGGGGGAEEPVYFADANLEEAMREEIGKPAGDIYPSDLAELTHLGASSRNISDLTGLEHCTSLTGLGLNDNQISDISPLTNLTDLRGLNLNDNQITDISCAANLTSLRSLALDSNQISDIALLVENEGLGEGDEVSLTDNPLSDDSIYIYIPQLEARGVTVDYWI